MNSDVSSFDALRKLAPYAKFYVLVCTNTACTNNFQKITTTWTKSEKIPWLIELQCSTCNKEWSICCDCHNVKTSFENNNQINQHRYKYHNSNRPTKRKQNKIYESNNSSLLIETNNEQLINLSHGDTIDQIDQFNNKDCSKSFDDVQNNKNNDIASSFGSINKGDETVSVDNENQTNIVKKLNKKKFSLDNEGDEMVSEVNEIQTNILVTKPEKKNFSLDEKSEEKIIFYDLVNKTESDFTVSTEVLELEATSATETTTTTTITTTTPTTTSTTITTTTPTSKKIITVIYTKK